MSDRFHSNKYSFIRFDNLSGFNAFENGESIGIDEVCKYIDKLEQQLEEANECIEFYALNFETELDKAREYLTKWSEENGN